MEVNHLDHFPTYSQFKKKEKIETKIKKMWHKNILLGLAETSGCRSKQDSCSQRHGVSIMIGSACGESLSGENGNQRSDYVNPSSQSAVRSRMFE